jgi:hypothetical protein
VRHSLVCTASAVPRKTLDSASISQVSGMALSLYLPHRIEPTVLLLCRSSSLLPPAPRRELGQLASVRIWTAFRVPGTTTTPSEELLGSIADDSSAATPKWSPIYTIFLHSELQLNQGYYTIYWLHPAIACTVGYCLDAAPPALQPSMFYSVPEKSYRNHTTVI